LVRDEIGDFLEDSHNILIRWKDYFSLSLYVHNVSDIRHIETHTAQPLVYGSCLLEVEISIPNLQKHKSRGSDEIPVEIIQELILFVM
jgi:hypothetical protein